jgi:catechol 2,3-dioxygenase-like lactoylglutathione lyase family enzyme
VISVQERNADDPAQRAVYFYSGRIAHGLQFVEPAKRSEPTAYYGRSSGVGRLMLALADRPALRVGVVGLGVGTLAAYAEPGQDFRFYELNGDVERFANRHFSFLRDCRGRHEVVLGDARLSLEREASQNFDVLVLDAFSGDAIPAHLLTREAFEIYARHLRRDSIVAIHISNRYLDLSQVVAGLADHFDYDSRRSVSQGDAQRGQFPADWILLARDPAALDAIAPAVNTTAPPRKVLWTDDHSDLFGILK